ncbi:hypothetical protein EDB86DRAFT_2980099, partial [Lactarius hatsudake]
MEPHAHTTALARADEAGQYLTADKQPEPTQICERACGQEDGCRNPPSVIWRASTCPLYLLPLSSDRARRGQNFAKIATGRRDAAHAPPHIRLDTGRRAEGRIRATLPHGHGGRRAHSHRVSASASSTAPTSAPAWPNSNRGGSGRRWRVVDAHFLVAETGVVSHHSAHLFIIYVIPGSGVPNSPTTTI